MCFNLIPIASQKLPRQGGFYVICCICSKKRFGTVIANIELNHYIASNVEECHERDIWKGWIAFCLDFTRVMFIRIVYYNSADIFSVLVLLFNLLLIVAALAYVRAAATLPGIADRGLTKGVGFNSNVLIFERIRKEIGRGGPIHTALSIVIAASMFTSFIVGRSLFQIVCPRRTRFE